MKFAEGDGQRNSKIVRVCVVVNKSEQQFEHHVFLTGDSHKHAA